MSLKTVEERSFLKVMKIFCALCALLFGFIAYTKSSACGYIETYGWQHGWLVTYSMTAFTALISCIRPFPNWCYLSGSILAFLHGILRLLNNTETISNPHSLSNNESIGPFMVSAFFIILSLAKWNIKPIA